MNINKNPAYIDMNQTTKDPAYIDMNQENKNLIYTSIEKINIKTLDKNSLIQLILTYDLIMKKKFTDDIISILTSYQEDHIQIKFVTTRINSILSEINLDSYDKVIKNKNTTLYHYRTYIDVYLKKKTSFSDILKDISNLNYNKIALVYVKGKKISGKIEERKNSIVIFNNIQMNSLETINLYFSEVYKKNIKIRLTINK